MKSKYRCSYNICKLAVCPWNTIEGKICHYGGEDRELEEKTRALIS